VPEDIMAPYDKQPRPRTTFEHRIQVEAQPTEFFVLASVPYQDVGKLAKAAHAEIELGYFKTSSSNDCRRFVRAKIREGMVTDLLVEPCCSDEETEPASEELVRLLDSARRRFTPSDSREARFPIPLAEFISDAAALTIRTITCVEICIFGSCFVCCSDPSGTTWFCGDRVIVHTD
jgi:hypothetical protein